MGNKRRRKRRSDSGKVIAKKIGTPESHPVKEIDNDFPPFRPWDSIDDVIPVVKASMSKELPRKWSWVANSRCKYIELRIDMRDGGCIIKDRKGNRISPAELNYQYGKDGEAIEYGDHEKIKKQALEQFEKDGYDENGFGGTGEILCPYCASPHSLDGIDSDRLLKCKICDSLFNVEVVRPSDPLFNTSRGLTVNEIKQRNMEI